MRQNWSEFSDLERNIKPGFSLGRVKVSSSFYVRKSWMLTLSSWQHLFG
ncbi:hypothetical protein AVDCRST_MAG81-979 [uncultured Synechococcales cyanobacterium]|uniref:Uncharacterized protein n=1 Tax=uncultured Synechococcales cyanobacterium TaxID=1936017 RepID=A0A6J4V4H3_9CYAN|nr:hypothetical protein AVDCRST_MAG81-979 [uncultured Synechococcales cyanobacterium]